MNERRTYYVNKSAYSKCTHITFLDVFYFVPSELPLVFDFFFKAYSMETQTFGIVLNFVSVIYIQCDSDVRLAFHFFHLL